jgi:hypothetical protein
VKSFIWKSEAIPADDPFARFVDLWQRIQVPRALARAYEHREQRKREKIENAKFIEAQ